MTQSINKSNGNKSDGNEKKTSKQKQINQINSKPTNEVHRRSPQNRNWIPSNYVKPAQQVIDQSTSDEESSVDRGCSFLPLLIMNNHDQPPTNQSSNQAETVRNRNVCPSCGHCRGSKFVSEGNSKSLGTNQTRLHIATTYAVYWLTEHVSKFSSERQPTSKNGLILIGLEESRILDCSSQAVRLGPRHCSWLPTMNVGSCSSWTSPVAGAPVAPIGVPRGDGPPGRPDADLVEPLPSTGSKFPAPPTPWSRTAAGDDGISSILLGYDEGKNQQSSSIIMN